MKDVLGLAQVLDWHLIMNFTWAVRLFLTYTPPRFHSLTSPRSRPPGPNAPLSSACHNSTQSSASAVADVATWTTAGFPASKVVLGVPSYGYILSSSANFLWICASSRGGAPSCP